MHNTIVELRAVTKHFAGNDHPALDEVTLGIRSGEIFGVIGESGAGKTTLLNLINGLETSDAGTTQVAGKDVSALDAAGLRALRRDIGVLFQGVNLLSTRTVRQNVALPQRLARRAGRTRTRAEERRRVDEMLAFVGLSHRADHHPAQLSGGARQRVGLARALVAGPEILLCDEPTSSLDAKTTADVVGLLRKAQTELGTTIIVITHDLDVVRTLCNRAALLENGRVTEVFDVARTDPQALPSYRDQVLRELGA